MNVVLTINNQEKNIEVIKDTFTLKECFFNNLKPSDSQCSFSVIWENDLSNLLKQNINDEIKAQVKEGNNIIFTGWIRQNISFKKTQKNQPIKIDVVSTSYKLDTCLQETYRAVKKTLTQIINELAEYAQFEKYTEIGTLDVPSVKILYFAIDANQSIKEALTNILYEYGCCYYFDNLGRFCVKQIFNDIPEDKTTITQTFNGSNINNAVNIQLKENEYDSVKANYKTTEETDNVTLFKPDWTKFDFNKFPCHTFHDYLGKFEPRWTNKTKRLVIINSDDMDNEDGCNLLPDEVSIIDTYSDCLFFTVDSVTCRTGVYIGSDEQTFIWENGRRYQRVHSYKNNDYNYSINTNIIEGIDYDNKKINLKLTAKNEYTEKTISGASIRVKNQTFRDKNGVLLAKLPDEIPLISNRNYFMIYDLSFNGHAFREKDSESVITEYGTKKQNEIDLQFIFKKEDAERFAKNLCDYYRFANNTIKLDSKSDYAVNSFVKIEDYGIGTYYGRIISKTTKLNSLTFSYEIETIDEYTPSEIEYYIAPGINSDVEIKTLETPIIESAEAWPDCVEVTMSDNNPLGTQYNIHLVDDEGNEIVYSTAELTSQYRISFDDYTKEELARWTVYAIATDGTITSASSTEKAMGTDHYIKETVEAKIRILPNLRAVGEVDEVAIFNDQFYKYNGSSWILLDKDKYLGVITENQELPNTINGCFFLNKKSYLTFEILVNGYVLVTSNNESVLGTEEAQQGYIYYCEDNEWKLDNNRNSYRYVIAANDIITNGYDLSPALTTGINNSITQETVSKKTPVYKGSFSSAPLTANYGDTFLFSGTSGDFYKKGCMYKFDGVNWILDLTAEKSFDDMLALVDSADNTSPIVSIVNTLATSEAFINLLKVKYVELQNGGYLKSNNYNGTFGTEYRPVFSVNYSEGDYYHNTIDNYLYICESVTAHNTGFKKVVLYSNYNIWLGDVLFTAGTRETVVIPNYNENKVIYNDTEYTAQTNQKYRQSIYGSGYSYYLWTGSKWVHLGSEKTPTSIQSYNNTILFDATDGISFDVNGKAEFMDDVHIGGNLTIDGECKLSESFNEAAFDQLHPKGTTMVYLHYTNAVGTEFKIGYPEYGEWSMQNSEQITGGLYLVTICRTE